MSAFIDSCCLLCFNQSMLITCLIVTAALCVFPPPSNRGDIPVITTWYDPALGGINCDDDCKTLADGGTWSSDDYGRVAACPASWMGKRFVTTAGEFLCRDTGGKIGLAWNAYYENWVFHVDIMSDTPISYNYRLWHKWAIKPSDARAAAPPQTAVAQPSTSNPANLAPAAGGRWHS